MTPPAGTTSSCRFRKAPSQLEGLAKAQGCQETCVPAGFTAVTFYRKHGYSEATDQSHATKDWIIMSKRIERMP